MKLAIIYDKNCPKLTNSAYSQTYRDMFIAVIERSEEVQHITESCSARDIEADVILIYDIHSSHHIQIDGLENHKAVKYTYYNDPHQEEFQGKYSSGPKVHKLGAEGRVRRSLLRGVDYIICPYTTGYFKYIAPYLSNPEDMLFWFPPAPSSSRFPLKLRPLSERKHKILGNGALNDGNIGGYKFRRWAYAQPETFYIKHTIDRPDVPSGINYGKLLCSFSAALALNGLYVVPKYLEIPLAGCVCFAQDQEDYRKMGFKHGINCLLVDGKNFKEETQAFLANEGDAYYQRTAIEGRKLISNKWTAECFADALYEHAKSKGAKCQRNESISGLNANVEKQNIPYQETMELAR